MSAKRRVVDHGASARARLYTLSRQRNVELQQLLSEFAVERLLYRLGISPHAHAYVLKGAMLFKLWADSRGRATWDLDLLGCEAHDVDQTAAVMRELCEIRAEDGIVFDLGTLRSEAIRTTGDFAGARVQLEAKLAGARIPTQVDVGFGGAVMPPPTLET